MRKVFLLLPAVAVLWLPRPATADDDQAKRPERPGMDMLMKRLDTNQDGVISKDEVPEQAPAFLKAMLKRADKDGDGKVTKEELAALRPSGPPRGPAREGPPKAGPPRGPGREGPPKAGPPRGLPKPPSAEAIFKRLDKDGDGKLSLEEFTVGVKAAQAIMVRLAARARPASYHRPGPPCPFGKGPQARPPHGRKPGPPQYRRPGGPHHGPPKAGPHGRPHHGPPKAGPHGRPPFGPPKAGPPGRPPHGPPKAGPPRGHKPGPPDVGKPGPKKPDHKRGDKDDDDDEKDDD